MPAEMRAARQPGGVPEMDVLVEHPVDDEEIAPRIAPALRQDGGVLVPLGIAPGVPMYRSV